MINIADKMERSTDMDTTPARSWFPMFNVLADQLESDFVTFLRTDLRQEAALCG